jgi:L-fucose mutarotase
MLKGIDPLLTGDLLRTLDQMGHGDRIVVADGNFPAASLGPPVIRVATGDIVALIGAVLDVLPLDTAVEQPLRRMCPDAGADAPNPTQRRVLTVAQERSGARELATIRRQEFYEESRDVFAIVQTLETAPYCDFILTKGTV